MADDAATRPGYRGKCLYKTGKCNNERALKTSGQPHNLCEEHRNRQNEHQRKLDAKNRYTRKDKRGGKPEGNGAAVMAAAVAATGPGHARHRFMPYNKMRMSPTNGGSPGDENMMANGAMMQNAMAAPPMMQFQSMGMPPTPPQMMPPGMPPVPPEMMPGGVVILPNGPQPPQLSYPVAMQDFDGIVVPLPSYLEGHERVEFRSRIYQKVLDFIAEECMRRFGTPKEMMEQANELHQGDMQLNAPRVEKENDPNERRQQNEAVTTEPASVDINEPSKDDKSEADVDVDAPDDEDTADEDMVSPQDEADDASKRASSARATRQRKDVV
ncbi:hypothetical protein Poli38472_012194 [Pythium oligandrum]|uniref:Uncharacterized protein n=1 Tax=Pythium oligandrum TaxID=41045 RepID=A0A8K1FQZ2_PYTOL|nr:hypothetical protein Poli38472_012194 [Pythium oligandrum]|eukprot:TMW67078.1 hypothetical protein Poli38472_012194 [Pythium oligandrum]